MAYRFSFTSDIVRSLQAIERARAEVGLTVLPAALLEHLRLRARLRSAHFSTRIEGNRLTLAEAEQVILEGRSFAGRERDTREVTHTFQALEQVEAWVSESAPVTEEHIRKLHAIVYSGRRARPILYRDGQNVIRDSAGGMVYLPPEAVDVPGLMKELVEWIRAAEPDLPVPVIAGVAHYQFVTVHPFYDGNGRTARALATWILYRSGYDLGRLYSLEEVYARDLPGYYDALVTHPHHNYYDGRADADITTWLDYFLAGMAEIFEAVAGEVRNTAVTHSQPEDELLRKLDRRGRMILGLFAQQPEITANDVARLLGLSARQSRDLIQAWVEQGLLEVSSAARRTRRYRLSAEYRPLISGGMAEQRRLVGGITAVYRRWSSG